MAQPSEVYRTLDRIEQGSVFHKADRQRRLLRYLVEKALSGDDSSVKEYVLGLEVFDRSQSFDPASDSIVRVEVRKLRGNLARFFETEGRNEAVLISIPKGSYQAIFEYRPIALAETKKRRTLLAGWVAAAVALMVVSVAAWKIWESRRGPTAAGNRELGAVAVLPFASLDGSTQEENFADGLTAELIDRFGKLPGLRVAARSAVLQFKGPSINRAKVRSELGVDAVVEGNVRIGGSRVRVAAQLVDAGTGHVLLSKTYDLETRDPLTAESEIAEAILATLHLQSANPDEQKLAVRFGGNPDARELYLHGLYGFDRLSREGLESSIQSFQGAIAADRNYAPAFSAMADSYVALAIYGHLAPADTIPQARKAAEAALALDGSLADPHAALGFAAAVYDWDWQEAQRQFVKSIQQNPECAHCRAWYALYFLGPIEAEREGRAQVEKAMGIDPFSATFPAFRIAVPLYARDYDGAAEEGKRAVSIDPNSFLNHLFLGAALREKGAIQQAIEEDRKAVALFRSNPIALRNLAEAYATAGQRDDALAILQKLQERAVREFVSPSVFAHIYAALGQTDQALDWLERAFDARDVYLIFLRASPMYSILEKNPRFSAMWKRIDPASRKLVARGPA